MGKSCSLHLSYVFCIMSICNFVFFFQFGCDGQRFGSNCTSQVIAYLLHTTISLTATKRLFT